MKSTLAIFGSVLLLISAILRLSQSPQQHQLTPAPAPRLIDMGRLMLTTAEPELAARLAKSASWQLPLKRMPASHGKLLLTHEGNGLLWRESAWDTRPKLQEALHNFTAAPAPLTLAGGFLVSGCLRPEQGNSSRAPNWSSLNAQKVGHLVLMGRRPQPT
jgi:hypothetical protein